mmetsp:Transcript_39163/g.84466  ORF Transcript_39163/g.84466 Transcript_39163/m.84466 type:complete len:150 (-) Transcript_39163:1025-1474(-)
MAPGGIDVGATVASTVSPEVGEPVTTVVAATLGVIDGAFVGLDVVGATFGDTVGNADLELLLGDEVGEDDAPGVIEVGTCEMVGEEVSDFVIVGLEVESGSSVVGAIVSTGSPPATGLVVGSRLSPGDGVGVPPSDGHLGQLSMLQCKH